jgi:hypothetical protein
LNRYLEGHDAKLQAQYALLRLHPFVDASVWEHRFIVQTQIGF